MKKKLIFSLIFLFSLMLLTFFQVKGATTTIVMKYNQILQPSQGSWFYQQRDNTIDFQTYLDGACPNLTVIGNINQDTTLGIYTVNSSKYRSVFSNVDNSTTNPFINFYSNLSDKVLLLDPTGSVDQVGVNYTISEFSYTQATVEFMMIHVVTADYSQYARFWVLTNEMNQFIFRIDPFLNGVNLEGRWSYYNGATYDHIFDVPYQRYTEEGQDLWWICYDVVLDYMLNAYATLTVLNMTSKTTASHLFNVTITPFQVLPISLIAESMLHIETNWASREPYIILGIDSSQLREDYRVNGMFEYITKNITANNVENVFNFLIPQDNQMLDTSITKVEIKSVLPSNDFVSFLTTVQGNLLDGITFSSIDNYVEIPSIYYTNDVNIFSINTKYRCYTLNEFNNTVMLRITYSYTPYTPTFSDVLLSIIAPTLLLIVPSGVAYVKFKKTGFLMMFFVMTLILTAVGLIPLVPGLLMIIVLVIIFLKLMKQTESEL